jgi:MFS family permease
MYKNKTALWVCIISVFVTLAMLAFAPTLPLAFIAAVLYGMAYGASQASYFALAMKYTQASIAASMYSILMAVTNVVQGIGLGVGGAMAKGLGYTPIFLIFGAAMFLIVLFFPVVFRKK